MNLDPALAPLASTKKVGRPPLMGGARRIGVSLPSATQEALQAIVARDGRALSAYVRDVLVDHVEALTEDDSDLVDEDPTDQFPPSGIRERIAHALKTGSLAAPATINWDDIPAPGGLLAFTVGEDRPLVCCRDLGPILPANQLPIEFTEEG